MKKSASITVTVAAAMGIACNRQRPDPCEAATFNEQACNEAVRNHGYHHNGTWVPMFYSHPYPYYYDNYRGYLSRGGSVRSAPAGTYSSPGVSRGGFGSTGSSHASGSSSSGGGAGSGGGS
jgi:hypothetical protein